MADSIASTSYLGNSNLKSSNVPINWTKEQIEEYAKCARDPIYFIQQYVKIISLDKGLVSFELYDFQEEMVRTVHTNRFVIAKLPRQTGKSTTITAYLLHYVLFNQSVNVAILANKMSTARELLSRLKLAYEYLPKWLQQGVIEWNKGSIQLENGSKVLASATSSSAIRGGSFNCISADSVIKVRVDGKELTTTIGELYANSSRNIEYYKYLHANDRKQIQELVFFSDGIRPSKANSPRGRKRETSYNTEVNWWDKRPIQSSHIDYTRAYISTSASSELSRGSRESENVSCIIPNGSWAAGGISPPIRKYDERGYEELFRGKETNANWFEAYRGNKEKDWGSAQRKKTNRNGKAKNKSDKHRTIGWAEATDRVWRTLIQCFIGEKENKRTFRQDKQESRKNKKDRRKASGDEEITRGERKDAYSSVGTNRTAGWTVEQRIEVLTSQGYKKFHGISKTTKQHTIKLIFSDGSTITCTEDHKISTTDGFVEARHLEECVHEINTISGTTILLNREEVGVVDVYDLLHVEDLHCFYANDVEVHNCILLDEFAYVPQNVAEEFFSSVYPTISSGQETKMIVVSTPHGMNLFYKLWTDATNNRNSYIPIEVHWSDVPGRDEKWKEETIANTSEEQFNTEHNCDFVGSIHTLISPSKLKTLAYVDPIFKNGEGFKVYEKPEKDHTYVMCVDVSRGTGNDYSAFTTIDITTTPYKLVASFRNNTMSPMVFPNAIHVAAKQYNNAHVLVEINDMGGQVAEVLHSELEYEHLLSATLRGRKGQVLDGGFGGGQAQMGVRTSEVVKRTGCSILKSLIESDKLIIQDFEVIKELFAFISKKNSFEAEVGYNDDLVMTLVIFGWLSTQPYFKDMSSLDIRKDVYQETINKLEEEMTPFGFIDDGIDDAVPEKGEDGSLWYRDKQNDRNSWY